MKIIYGTVFLSCLIALAVGAPHRHPLQQQILLEIEKRGTVAARVDQEMEMFTMCETECIKDVLQAAKNFHENALSTGACMYTTDDGEEEEYLENGEHILTEEKCDEVEQMWIENIKGGPIDILKNAYQAFRVGPGHGVIKMFFTVVSQGFYMIKDRIVTTIGVHTRIRDAWMSLTKSASKGLGSYPFRTEKRSLYDKARVALQDVLDGPISSICNILPSFGVSFGVSTEVSLSNLCVTGLKSLVNHYLGWMKKQIKNMLRKIFEAKGQPEIGKKITKVLVAPLGKVFLSFEQDMIKTIDGPFSKIFALIKDIITDLQKSKVQVRLRAIEEIAAGYCWDDMNQEIFTGEDKTRLADEEYAKNVETVMYRTRPMVDGLDEALEEHTELFQGYAQDEKIEDKIERLVFVASLVFDPRVANVWSSDMIDALITETMTRMSVAMTTRRKADKLLKQAANATAHLNSNSITTRKRFKAALRAIDGEEKNLTMEEIVGNHEQRVEELKSECWKDTKGAQCFALHMMLKKAKRRMPITFADRFGFGKRKVDTEDKDKKVDTEDKKAKEEEKEMELESLIEVKSETRGFFSRKKKKPVKLVAQEDDDEITPQEDDDDDENDAGDEAKPEEAKPEEAKPKKKSRYQKFKDGAKKRLAKAAAGVKSVAKSVAAGAKMVANTTALIAGAASKNMKNGLGLGPVTKESVQKEIDDIQQKLNDADCPSEEEMLDSRFNKEALFLQLDMHKERKFML